MSTLDIDELVSLRGQGLSLRKVADRVGSTTQTVRRALKRAGVPTRFTEAERYWFKVRKTESCWVWESTRDSSGYGQFRRESGVSQKAHRVAYEWLRGPIPDGLQLDHLCRERTCVNPDHLEPVTPRENTMRAPLSRTTILARRISCAEGHVLGTEENRFPSAGRTCRTCQRERQARPTPCPVCGVLLRADSIARHQRRRHVDERGRS